MKSTKISLLLLISFFNLIALQAQTNDTELSSQDYIFDMGINSLWNYTTGSSSNSIGIISLGIPSSHPDLTGRFQIKTNRLNDLNYVGAINPILGIIGAKTNNGIGIAGIDWNSNMLVYDVGKKETISNLKNQNGQTLPPTSVVTLNTSKVDDDIYQSITDGAKVIYVPFNWYPYSASPNLSAPSFQVYPDLRPADDQKAFYTSVWNVLKSVFNTTNYYGDAMVAAKSAFVNGRLIVGVQNAYNGNFVGFPNSLSHEGIVLSVGSASSSATIRYPYSSIAYDQHKLDLVAIGEDLRTVAETGSGYTDYTNTFGAGAIVTGVSSLLFDLDNNLLPEDIINILRYTADPIGINPGDENTATGWGLINAAEAADFVDSFTFQRGTVNASTSIKVNDGVVRTIHKGIWAVGAIPSSGKYIVDIYEVTASLDISPFNEVVAWYRTPGTTGMSIKNPNYQTPFAQVTNSGNKINFKTHSWFIEDTYPGAASVDIWRPVHKDNVQVAYTIATRPITQNTRTVFVNNTTITSADTYSAESIFIDDDVTVVIESTVNMNGTTISLGNDAKIEVRNGGKLITNGQTLFTRLNALEEHNGVRLYTSNNQIENTTFEGGSYGLYMGSNSDNNTIEGSVFEGNQYGIYAYNSDNAVIKGSTFEDSDVAAIWAYYSSLDVDPNVTSGQTKTSVKNSSGYGIVASSGSNVSVRNTTLTNITKHEFMVYSSGRMDLGYYSSGNTDHGKNVLSDAPNPTSNPVFYRYVYSTALTGSGETATQWTVPARKNYWHDGNAPSWNDFYGSVDYSNHLTSPPAGAAKVIAFNTVESAETGQNMLKQGFSSTQVDNSIRFSQSIQELKEEIASLTLTYDPRIAKLIRSYSGMIDASDKALMKEEIRELRQLKRKWFAQYQYVNDMAITDTLTSDISQPDMDELNTSEPDTGLVKRISAVQTIGEVMLALELRSAIDNENYDRVFKLVKEYDGRVRGKDLKFELISYMIKASIETQRNDLALRLIDRLEAMEPEEALLDDWIPLDFTSLRHDITDHGKAKGVSYDDDNQLAKAFASDIYLDTGEDLDETVSDFKLYPAYPNPFNPSTIVSFDLPQQGKVRVDVFDISGRLVSVLANQTYQSGNHRLTFEASGLASGVYLVRANIAGKLETQRITLIK